MKLTKEQKIIVLCSLIYVIFIYLAADVHLKHNDDMLRFMIFTIGAVCGYMGLAGWKNYGVQLENLCTHFFLLSS